MSQLEQQRGLDIGVMGYGYWLPPCGKGNHEVYLAEVDAFGCVQIREARPPQIVIQPVERFTLSTLLVVALCLVALSVFIKQGRRAWQTGELW